MRTTSSLTSAKKIDASRDPMRYIRDTSQPFYVTGTELEVEIPFTGGAEAFNIQPNPYTLNPPRARVRGSMVVFSIVGTNLGSTAVRREIDSTVASIQSYLTNLRANVDGLNSQLLSAARSAIDSRRQKLLASKNMVAALGFKIKMRDGDNATFVAPEVRRKITSVLPVATNAPSYVGSLMLLKTRKKMN